MPSWPITTGADEVKGRFAQLLPPRGPDPAMRDLAKVMLKVKRVAHATPAQLRATPVWTAFVLPPLPGWPHEFQPTRLAHTRQGRNHRHFWRRAPRQNAKRQDRTHRRQ